jgi:hypothetical protein
MVMDAPLPVRWNQVIPVAVPLVAVPNHLLPYAATPPLKQEKPVMTETRPMEMVVLPLARWNQASLVQEPQVVVLPLHLLPAQRYAEMVMLKPANPAMMEIPIMEMDVLPIAVSKQVIPAMEHRALVIWSTQPFVETEPLKPANPAMMEIPAMETVVPPIALSKPDSSAREAPPVTAHRFPLAAMAKSKQGRSATMETLTTAMVVLHNVL